MSELNVYTYVEKDINTLCKLNQEDRRKPQSQAIQRKRAAPELWLKIIFTFLNVFPIYLTKPTRTHAVIE